MWDVGITRVVLNPCIFLQFWAERRHAGLYGWHTRTAGTGYVMLLPHKLLGHKCVIVISPLCHDYATDVSYYVTVVSYLHNKFMTVNESGQFPESLSRCTNRSFHLPASRRCDNELMSPLSCTCSVWFTGHVSVELNDCQWPVSPGTAHNVHTRVLPPLWLHSAHLVQTSL